MKEFLHCGLDFADKIFYRRSLGSFRPGSISASVCTSRLGMSPVGRRDDYRRRDEWGNPTTPASWRNKISSSLPVSLTAIILAICIIIFFLSLVAPYFVIEYLSLIPAFLFERPWTIVTYMFVHLTFDHL
ncbi:MAG: hypothetical protein QUS09_05210, partial [Methanotrichaceae archaeon]|nr:hypothetical protein [Methanotrichaceae archaeon]